MTGNAVTHPSEAVIVERAKSFCNEAIFTVALQCRRLKTPEPEDQVFIFRWYADLQFLILALQRLRRGAKLAAEGVPSVAATLNSAIKEFDSSLPGLRKMRNVGEHFDDYVRGSQKNQHTDVSRADLQVSTWNGQVFTWLGAELDIDVALQVSERLFAVVAEAARKMRKETP